VFDRSDHAAIEQRETCIGTANVGEQGSIHLGHCRSAIRSNRSIIIYSGHLAEIAIAPNVAWVTTKRSVDPLRLLTPLPRSDLTELWWHSKPAISVQS
jgi:hypothetical protein